MHRQFFPKLKLTSRLLRIAYRFVDVEASGEAAPPSGRIIEYSFVISKLNSVERGKVLDVGCVASNNYIPAALAYIGWEVYGIDTREFKFKHPNFHFICEDIMNTSFPDNFFDYVYAVSTLEHIGLRGRYGITVDDPEGDVKAVKEIARILRPNGKFLVTVPYGKGTIVKPFKRIYDKTMLHKLIFGWRVEDEIYYIQDSNGYWLRVSEDVAAQVREPQEATALLELSPVR